MSREEQMQQDLKHRLAALYEPPHSTSECFESTRTILLEAVAWSALAFGTWILAVTFL